jgi:carbon monoxide dehydrogenase subunit G
MAKIVSRVGTIEQDSDKIYSFLSNFNNFKNIVPADKVENWESTEENCSFDVQGVGKANMQIIEKEPSKLVKIEGAVDAMANISFKMWIQLKEVEQRDTKFKITMDPQLNPMMQMMAKKPLEEFMNMLVNQIEQFKFPEQ